MVDVAVWNGSLASTIPDEKQVPSDLIKADGIVYGKDGFPETRPGWRLLGDGLSPGNIQHLDAFYPTPTTAVLMAYTYQPVGAAGSNDPRLWAWTRQDAFETDGKGAVDVGAPSGGDMTSAVMNNLWFFTYNAPSDTRLLYYDGDVVITGNNTTPVGSVSTVPDAPAAKRVFFANNRLWVVSPDEPSTLRGSAPDAPLDWTIQANGSVRLPINAGDSGTISTIVSFGGTKLVFKDDPDGGSIHNLDEGIGSTGTIQFSRRTLTDAIGAVSHRSVVVVGDRQLFFASRKGIHTLTRTDKFGDVESSYIDFEVSDIWRSLSLAQQRRAMMLDDAKNDRILLSYDTDNDGFNDETVAIHYARASVRQYPSFSKLGFGFNAGTRLTMAGTINNDLVVGRLF